VIKSHKNKFVTIDASMYHYAYWEHGGNIEEGVEKGVEKLSEKQKIILSLIRKNPGISKKQIAIKGKLSKKSVEYNIRKLKKRGILKRTGPAKGGHWEIVDGNSR